MWIKQNELSSSNLTTRETETELVKYHTTEEQAYLSHRKDNFRIVIFIVVVLFGHSAENSKQFGPMRALIGPACSPNL